MREPSEATSLCTFCPKLCRHTCPVADVEKSETTTPGGKMSIMKMVEDKKLPMTQETMGAAYKCLNCRASEEACGLDNPVAPTLNTYRVRAFRAGLAPEGIAPYCRAFQKHNNPFGKDLHRELEKKFPGKMKERRKVVYFPGCTEIAHDSAMTEKTLRLFKDLKVSDLGLYPERIQCCGYPLFVAGDWEGFRELAEVNGNTLRDYTLIVSGAPACLYTMETLYPSAGTPVSTRFLHTTQYLQRLVAKSNYHIKKNSHEEVAYHDPCYLGRYRKVYDEPRELIQRVSGRPPMEFMRNREEGYCCGGGGLLPVSFPEMADQITQNRLDEFKRTGADLLVSSCPTCIQRFRRHGKGIRVKNLVEYIQDAVTFEK